MAMGLLREYLWLWVICGMVFGSVLIATIFFLINKWISKSGKHRVSKLQRGFLSNVESNNYQERVLSSVTPPLPPRTQFLTAECQSYENLAEAVDDEDYEEPLSDYEQATDEQQLDYVKVDYEEDLLPPPPAVLYQVPDEEDLLPPPPPVLYQVPDADDDDASTEDYDDIAGEDDNEDEEDYDDLG
ncbi:ciliogenesis-associated TTC17-interacting protein-like [Limanda limanda]|uniref:ciliogenesis-associated TTC17-interacting protein-like n=1 Tax=Limanda limanda TaxID=27771 RepID=UPI0029C8D928|nr:ciliogenesis-associated TTC17-interacting protein-like [Limanda limanda]XP_060941761.1 ciliogenesis-associated TTC17-interacting protein-like [Limanda limanda]